MSEFKYDINKMTDEIVKCFNDGYYLASLMETLVLPDICCKIEETKTDKKGSSALSVGNYHRVS